MSLLRLYARVLFASLALTPCIARADPVGFSYSWSISGGDVSASGSGPISLSQTTAPDGSSVTVNYGGGTTTLTVAAAGTGSTTPGGADFSSAIPAIVPLGTLTTSALTGPVGNFSFSANNTITLNLTDTASGQSGTLTLTGSVYGNVSPDGTTLGVSASGGFWQTVALGDHTYSVDTVNSLPDTAPGNDPVSYVAQVYVDRPAPDFFPPLATDKGVAGVPEPSSLLLAGCALSLWGGAVLRRRGRVA